MHDESLSQDAFLTQGGWVLSSSIPLPPKEESIASFRCGGRRWDGAQVRRDTVMRYHGSFAFLTPGLCGFFGDVDPGSETGDSVRDAASAPSGCAG